MTNLLKCECCRETIKPNPRSKNQKYCGKPACQRARKRKWQKEKMASDPDYQKNQRKASIEWRRKNPDYYQRYRASAPDYTQRNRDAPLIAKKDTIDRNGHLQ